MISYCVLEPRRSGDRAFLLVDLGRRDDVKFDKCQSTLKIRGNLEAFYDENSKQQQSRTGFS